MTSADTRRALLNSLSSIDHRNWDSPEKNNRVANLVQRIKTAINSGDQNEIAKLVEEMQHFISPHFTLFERMGKLVREQANKSWAKTEDRSAWKNLIDRTRIVVARHDKDEIGILARQVVLFLQARNGHNISRPIEEAMKLAKLK